MSSFIGNNLISRAIRIGKLEFIFKRLIKFAILEKFMGHSGKPFCVKRHVDSSAL